jgi:spore germination cell wall hydrolase CwlJ-like protein
MLNPVIRKGLALLIITTAMTIITDTGSSRNAEAGSIRVESINTEVLFHKNELHCLTDAIYFEARNQSVKGMIAVGQVIMNRKYSGKFGKNVCEVIHQRVNRVCQFSYLCKSKSYRTVDDLDSWDLATRVAHNTYNGYISDITNGATFYHNRRVKPKWRKNVEKTITIKDHVFYRRIS